MLNNILYYKVIKSNNASYFIHDNPLVKEWWLVTEGEYWFPDHHIYIISVFYWTCVVLLDERVAGVWVVVNFFPSRFAVVELLISEVTVNLLVGRTSINHIALNKRMYVFLLFIPDPFLSCLGHNKLTTSQRHFFRMTANDAALLDAVTIPVQVAVNPYLLGWVNVFRNLKTLFDSWLFHNLPFVLPFYSTLYIVNVNGVALTFYTK